MIRWTAVILIGALAVPLSGVAADPRVLFDPLVREQAQRLSAAVETEPTATLLEALDGLATDARLTPAQRDAVAWDLVRRLRRLDAEQVPMALMDRLLAWSPQAFRRHEESPNWQVPLFDVARSAQGLIHQWAYAQGLRDATGQGSDLLRWTQRYLGELGQPYGRGVRAGLFDAPAWQLDKLIAISRDDPALRDTLLPELWLARGDVPALGAWLQAASETRAGELLGRARRTLDPLAYLDLGKYALDHPAAATRALALAQQTDAWLELEAWPSAWAEALWVRRSDPALASAIDLQLIRLQAPMHWRTDPSTAPPGALGSEAFEQLQSRSQSLQLTAGGAR